MRLVIVGSGPAGIFAVETIRRVAPTHTVVMVSMDHAVAQSPVMLTYWMAGNRPRDIIFFRNASWAKQMKIDVRLGRRTRALDTSTHSLILEDGEALAYDRLLLATGAAPITLPIPGIEAKGVNALRHAADAAAILGKGVDIKAVMIIGGGFIGLKLACHLKARGLQVTVFEKESKLAARILDNQASFQIEKWLCQKEIGVETGVEVVEILDQRGWVSGVRMGDGRVIPCQSLVQAVGVRPNTQVLSGSPIEGATGVLVNDRMETSVPGVYAAGDVALTIDSISGERMNNATWPAATRQGTVAGFNMIGQRRKYIHNFPINALNLMGLRVVSAGHSYYETDSPMTVYKLKRGESYRKIVLHAGRLIGFLLVGDISGAGLLLGLMKRKIKISSKAKDLLKGRFSAHDLLPPNLGHWHGLPGMYRENSISKGDYR